MKEEEKLLKLLQVAVENGWNPTLKWNWILESKAKMLWTTDTSVIVRNDRPGFILSVNDLVTNWEEGETSFIEALCKASKLEDVVSTHPTYYKIIWVEKPTSQRLNWLFKTFNHLL